MCSCGCLLLADASEDIVVEFGDDAASAVLMSDVLVNETISPTSACLSMQLGVSSSAVNVTIATASSLTNLDTSSQSVAVKSCHPRRSCYWQRAVVIDSGDRLFITARKLRATRGTLTFVTVANVSLTAGTCSGHSSASKCKVPPIDIVIFLSLLCVIQQRSKFSIEKV